MGKVVCTQILPLPNAGIDVVFNKLSLGKGEKNRRKEARKEERKKKRDKMVIYIHNKKTTMI